MGQDLGQNQRVQEQWNFLIEGVGEANGKCKWQKSGRVENIEKRQTNGLYVKWKYFKDSYRLCGKCLKWLRRLEKTNSGIKILWN